MQNVTKIAELPVESSADATALTPSMRTVRALIVEDNGFDRRRITHAAREAGLSLDFAEAANCAEARRLLETQTFGLCIFDYRLPDGDGVALIDGLRQDGHSKRVLREPCAARAGARA